MKKNYIIGKYIICILFLLFDLYGFSQNQTLEEAKKNEEEKKINDAVYIYKTWLKENSGDDEFINVLQHVILLESNSKELLTFLYEIETISGSQKEKLFIAESIALLEEFHGNLSRAMEYYLYVYKNGTDNERFLSVLSAAQILFKQGILDQSLEDLAVIFENVKDKEILVKAGILKSSIHIARGEWDKAKNNYVSLIKLYKSTTMYPVILLGYLECLLFLGDEEEVTKVLDVFKKYFPFSPEYSLALKSAGMKEEGRISYYPSPSSFINDLKDDEDSYIAEPVKTNEEMDTVFIQTGSFIKLENAEDMVKELKKNNINAIIKEKIINNINYYSVLIELESFKPEIINDSILRLKEAGFEGFLVIE